MKNSLALMGLALFTLNAHAEPVAKGAPVLIEPQMVTIPSGPLKTTCKRNSGCTGKLGDALTVEVTAFKLAAYEVTFAEYDVCVDAGACHKAKDQDWGRGQQPVIHVSWDDAQAYIAWLNEQTGKQYRLPTEVEWEYAAQAGTETAYSWGDDIDCSKASYDGGKDSRCRWIEGGEQRGPSKAGSFPANPWGLYDMHGNVMEWVQDCYYKDDNCKVRVLRGGGWSGGKDGVKSSARTRTDSNRGSSDIGFRLAHD